MRLALPLIVFCIGLVLGRLVLPMTPIPSLFGKPTTTAIAIAAQFEQGAITHSDVSPLSISEISTEWNGHSILVTWYPGPPRHLRTLAIDGTEGVFPSSADEEIIFDAALNCADHLIEEKMQEIAKSK